MRVRWVWAAWTWAIAGISAVGMSACSEVESCKEDEIGCINNVPDNSGNCLAGLVPNADGTACIKKGGVAPAANNSCGCKTNELCRGDGQCVNVCTAPTNLPARTSPTKTCRPYGGEAAYDFAKASVALCYQTCIRRAALCGTACNPETECGSVAAMALVSAICPGQMPECAMKLCEQARDTPCAQQQCPNGAAPNCTGVSCSNSCITDPKYNNDGICDDGDLSNAYSVVCDWGTDCGDCGPRRGVAPPFKLDLGDPCFDPLQCGGDRTNVAASTGWCVPTDEKRPLSRCVPDCSKKGSTCPSGYECFELLQDTNDDGQPEPVIDSKNVRAQACFPLLCGT